MPDEFALLVKGQSAVGTLVWFLDAASLYVPCKLRACVESLGAVLALITKFKHA